MTQQVKVPTVGESITEVTIANWLKKDGDVVKMDEVIAELESDKATFELTAPQAGTLKITKSKGEVVPIGTVICEIADGGATATAPTLTPTTKETKINMAPDAKSQKLSEFRKGNATSRAPICKGKTRLIKPKTRPIPTKKIIVTP